MRHTTRILITVAVLMLGIVGGAGTASAQDAGIEDVEIVDKVDKDGDGYYSSFSIEINADTFAPGEYDCTFFGCDPAMEPYFAIDRENGVNIKNTDLVPRDGDLTYTVSISEDEIRDDFESGNQYNLIIKLVDRDPGIDDKVNEVTETVKLEHASDDNPPTNTPPTPSFTYSPNNPDVGESVTFDASGSSDPDGTVQRFEWDFGDGNVASATGATVTHTYSSAGTYTVELTVEDDEGATDTTTQTVSVDSGGDGGDDGKGIDSVQTTLSDTDGDGLSDRIEADVTVSDVSSGRTTVRLGESNFDVDISPTETSNGNQAQFVLEQDTDGDGTPEAVEFTDLGAVSTTYTVVADLSNQADGDTGTVEVELGGGTTSSTSFSIGEPDGPLSPNNPFGNQNGQPLGINDAADVLFEWNSNNGVVDGESISAGEMANHLFEWNQARA
jgi:PKD repeat protein